MRRKRVVRSGELPIMRSIGRGHNIELAPTDPIEVKIFAENGDKVEIPAESENEVNFNTGYPPSYSISPLCGGKIIKREEFNQIFNQNSIQQKAIADRLIPVAESFNRVLSVIHENWVDYLPQIQREGIAPNIWIKIGTYGQDYGELEFRFGFYSNAENAPVQISFNAFINPDMTMRIWNFNYFTNSLILTNILPSHQQNRFMGLNLLACCFVLTQDRNLYFVIADNEAQSLITNSARIFECSINQIKYSKNLRDYPIETSLYWDSNMKVIPPREGGGTYPKGIGEHMFIPYNTLKSNTQFALMLYNDGLIELNAEVVDHPIRTPAIEALGIIGLDQDMSDRVLRAPNPANNRTSGTYLEPQLPNITAEIWANGGQGLLHSYANEAKTNGAFEVQFGTKQVGIPESRGGAVQRIFFKANRSNPIYSDEGDVRMRALVSNLFVRAF